MVPGWVQALAATGAAALALAGLIICIAIQAIGNPLPIPTPDGNGYGAVLVGFAVFTVGTFLVGLAVASGR
jgi:hypothetical protein